MLSRVADSTCWMGRYVERAENVARFVDVNLNLMLDSPSGLEQQWQPLIQTTGDDESFARRYGAATRENVIHFLTFDPENPNSILSCLRSARENARSIREIISSEMWEQINRFYLMVREAAANPPRDQGEHGFYTAVKEASHLFEGLAEATLMRNEAWHFLRLGRMLERADKTSRILDVKYFILLRSVADVGTPFDDIQWAAVLRSASAFEMYRKRHGRLSPEGVVQFLLLDPEFPRAIRFCLNSARDSLHAISATPLDSFKHPPERLLGQLCSDLAYASVKEIVQHGLHEYLDDLQTRMNRVSQGVFDTFFARRMPESGKKSTLHRHGQ
ncbi:MAG: alpha-E domain-containing protein [Verrucomicrobia bacterium]|nr:alpha-E domain-containing protein [Verrucomicrobiota bacterium]